MKNYVRSGLYLIWMSAAGFGCVEAKSGDDRIEVSLSSDGGIKDDAGLDGGESGLDANSDGGDAAIGDGGRDAGADAGSDAAIDLGLPPVGTGVQFTIGGGRASSTGYRATVVVGAGEPAGRASSTGFEATVGTGAQFNEVR